MSDAQRRSAPSGTGAAAVSLPTYGRVAPGIRDHAEARQFSSFSSSGPSSYLPKGMISRALAIHSSYVSKAPPRGGGFHNMKHESYDTCHLFSGTASLPAGVSERGRTQSSTGPVSHASFFGPRLFKTPHISRCFGRGISFSRPPFYEWWPFLSRREVGGF